MIQATRPANSRRAEHGSPRLDVHLGGNGHVVTEAGGSGEAQHGRHRGRGGVAAEQRGGGLQGTAARGVGGRGRTPMRGREGCTPMMHGRRAARPGGRAVAARSRSARAKGGGALYYIQHTGLYSEPVNLSADGSN